MVDPARLARGLRRACLDAGVRLFEHTAGRGRSRDDGAGLSADHRPTAACGPGRPRWPPAPTSRCCAGSANYFVPVYDYVLVTEPLSAAQLASLGWRNRQGAADAGNQFHYFRLTADNRVLWGGYDAVYFNGGTGQRRPTTSGPRRSRAWPGTSSRTFPQLEDVSVRVRVGRRHRHLQPVLRLLRDRLGRLGYACGHTGLGVGASRFRRQRRPGPAGRAAHRADRAGPWSVPARCRSRRSQPGRRSFSSPGRRWPVPTGTPARRNLWLRTLDRLGLGFDS